MDRQVPGSGCCKDSLQTTGSFLLCPDAEVLLTQKCLRMEWLGYMSKFVGPQPEAKEQEIAEVNKSTSLFQSIQSSQLMD